MAVIHQTHEQMQNSQPPVSCNAKGQAAAKAKTPEKSLYKKILQVQKNMQHVGKNGYNAFHKYTYVTESDLLDAVKGPMSEQGLIAIPTITSQETGFRPDGKSWAKVSILFKVIDVENGEEIESMTTGYAEDTSDKAIYKAITGASKYFYMKFFGVASDDDPENEKTSSQPPSLPIGKPVKPSVYKAQPLAKSVSEIQTGSPPPVDKTSDKALQARVIANMILDLQNKYHLSNQDILACGELDSLKGAVERGDIELLEKAHFKIAESVNPNLNFHQRSS